MKDFIVLIIAALSINALAADKSMVLECDDERKDSLKTRLFISQNLERTSRYVNAIEIYEDNRLVDSERGRFVSIGCVDEENGAIGVQCEYEFYPVGESQTLGSIVVTDGRSGRISMQLMDRHFRGSCLVE